MNNSCEKFFRKIVGIHSSGLQLFDSDMTILVAGIFIVLQQWQFAMNHGFLLTTSSMLNECCTLMSPRTWRHHFPHYKSMGGILQRLKDSKLPSLWSDVVTYEPRCEKTGLRGF